MYTPVRYELAQLKNLTERQRNELAQLKNLTERQRNELAQLKDLTERQRNELAQLKDLTERQNNELAQLKDQTERQSNELENRITYPGMVFYLIIYLVIHCVLQWCRKMFSSTKTPTHSPAGSIIVMRVTHYVRRCFHLRRLQEHM